MSDENPDPIESKGLAESLSPGTSKPPVKKQKSKKKSRFSKADRAEIDSMISTEDMLDNESSAKKDELTSDFDKKDPSEVAPDKQKPDWFSKKKLKLYGFSGGGLLFAYLIYLMFQPYQGSMAYGVCRVFLEMQLRYPETMKIRTVNESYGYQYTDIFFAHTDAFGEYLMHRGRCRYKYDDYGRIILTQVQLDRRDVDPQIVTNFNQAIDAVYGNPPDLVIPFDLEDSLADLHVDYRRFMRPMNISRMFE